MTKTYRTTAKDSTWKNLDLERELQQVENSGEVEQSAVVVAMLDRMAFEEARPNALTPQRYEEILEDLKGWAQEVEQCQSQLRDWLDYQTEGHPLPICGTRQEINKGLTQLSTRTNLLLNMVHRYQESLPEECEGIYSLYLRQGVRYCTEFICRNGDWDALTQQYGAMPEELFPLYLQRIYSYLNQLPDLYLQLAKRLADALFEQIPPIDRPDQPIPFYA
jgi:hypothetical protein